MHGQGAGAAAERGWELGKKHLSEGRAQEAKQVFEDLLESDPGNADLHLALGLALLQLREAQRAEIHVRKAVKLAPSRVEARSLLGWIHLELRRDYVSAAAEYAQVVRLRPQLPEAHNNLGVALRRKGDLEGATASFGRAVELKPDYGEAWSNRGWAYAAMQRWGEARADFERALAINPEDEGALYGLSQALKEARDYGGAGRMLGRLIRLSPNFVYWLEWAELQLVRYYWALLLVAVAFFARARYRARGKSGGGTHSEEA